MSEHLSNPNQPPISTPELVEQEKWRAVFDTVEGLGLQADSTERANQVGMLTSDTILDVATRLHTTLVPEASHQPTENAMHVQGQDGSNRRALVAPAERAGLYDLAAGLVRKLGTERQLGEDEAYLKRASNVVALSLVLAHPFEDGNGRTARTFAEIVREGYDGGAKIQDDIKQVGSNRPPTGFRILSYVPTKEGVTLSPQELLLEAASTDIPLANHDEYVTKVQSYFTSPYGGD